MPASYGKEREKGDVREVWGKGGDGKERKREEREENGEEARKAVSEVGRGRRGLRERERVAALCLAAARY